MNRVEGGSCLSMHQPWASLLVHGIKRIEGRSWPSPLTGELWIHAAGKVPDPATIKVMEDYYREIYAVNGITDLKFPEHYPVSQLLGCVKVVGCIKSEELAWWEDVPESVRLEALTDFCWLCEEPKKLVIPLQMRGYKGVYNLDRKMYEDAVRGLCPVGSPQPVQFPLPDPQNLFSLKPGSLLPYFPCSKTPKPEKLPSLTAAIIAARAAATQFSKREVKYQTSTFQERRNFDSSPRQHSENKYTGEDKMSNVNFQRKTRERGSIPNAQNTEDSRKSTGRLQWQPEKRESVYGYNAQNIRNSSREQSESRFNEVNRHSTGTSQLRPQEGHSVHNYKEKHTHTSYPSRQPEKIFTEDGKSLQWKPRVRDSVQGYKGQNIRTERECEANNNSSNQAPHRDLNLRFGDSSKIFTDALKGLKLT